MARIECYVSDSAKEKLTKFANKKSIALSKYISQVLENHLDDGENQSVFQKKVMTTLFEILSCVYNSDAQSINHETVASLMRDIKKQCEESVLTAVE